MIYFVLATGLVAMAVLAQAYRIQRDYFAKEVLKQYEWIDEIIVELEGKTEN